MTGLLLAQDAGKPTRTPDASDTFFSKGAIPELRIQISDEQLEKLKSENRKYVRCTIVENRRTTFRDVGIKLKGAAGSFREFDDRPALTLNAGKFYRGQSFHALSKFHLNNSVQDETYIHEWLCEELFRAAGIPAPRVTHARVWLNDRDVGLYVLKEGFDRTFLKRHFDDPNGNLYDGGFLQDVDQDLEKDSGEGPDDHSDLKQLLEACREQDPGERHRKLEEVLKHRLVHHIHGDGIHELSLGWLYAKQQQLSNLLQPDGQESELPAAWHGPDVWRCGSIDPGDARPDRFVGGHAG